jgi:hypothetical protein
LVKISSPGFPNSKFLITTPGRHEFRRRSAMG